MLEQGWGAAAAKDLLAAAASVIPKRLLRWRWPTQKLLAAIVVVPEGQPPQFYVNANRPSHAFEYMSFHVFNLSPLPLALVGAELELVINSTTLLKTEERFASEIVVLPNSHGGFPVNRALSEQQSRSVHAVQGDWVRIRLRGNVIVKSLFGEQRKDVHADVVASIER